LGSIILLLGGFMKVKETKYTTTYYFDKDDNDQRFAWTMLESINPDNYLKLCPYCGAYSEEYACFCED